MTKLKAFLHLGDMSQRLRDKLKKLVPSKDDPMYKILELHENGYVGDYVTLTVNGPRYFSPRYRENVDKQKRSAIVAYNKNGKPIGWCVSDDFQVFQIFVHPRYRGRGIAKLLTGAWFTFNIAYVRRNAEHSHRLTAKLASGKLLESVAKNHGIYFENNWS